MRRPPHFATVAVLAVLLGITASTPARSTAAVEHADNPGDTAPPVAPADVPGSASPALPLVLADGTRLPAGALRAPALLVIFQPACRHCQEEAEAIHAHSAALRAYHIYFVSSAPLEDSRAFAAQHGLDEMPNVRIAHADDADILRCFGSIRTPSSYIYNKEGRLTRSLHLGTTIVDLLAAL